jgi:RHS repeat-associated protein
VYGFEGELLAEYAANGAATSPQREYGYRNGQLLITAERRVNVALASNGASATASSTYAGYPASNTINGNRLTGEWNDAAPAHSFPDWLQVDFSSSKTIDEIDVVTLQDAYQNPSEPTESMTFLQYGLTGYEVQYWNGSAWVTVPGGSISGNNKVWRKLTFAPITTSKIRVVTNASPDGWSRLVELEAWSSGSGGSGATARLNWLVTDQLGTPRMILDQTGSLAGVKRHDYLPFGEEISAFGGRTTAQGYNLPDATRQKFTRKERDNETGLDYFLARYYSSRQGRFTSPDEFKGGARELYVLGSGDPEKQALAYADIFSPQSLNKYQYCLNNPLRYIDPDGHDWRIIEEKDQEGRLIKRYVWDANYTYKKGDKNGTPSNARYIDSQGRAIQLWGDNNKDLKKGVDHGYQVVEPTKEGFERYVNQSGDAPTSYVSYDDTKTAVLAAGYNQHYLDIHPDHWGGEDFSKPTSPTLHITLFPQNRIGDSSRSLPAMVTGHLPLKDATFHGEKHTQAGTWSDLGRHLKDAAKQTVGLKP